MSEHPPLHPHPAPVSERDSARVPPSSAPGQSRWVALTLRSPLLAFASALVLVGVVAWLFVAGGLERVGELVGARAQGGLPAVGGRAPTFSLPSASGSEISLADLAGQPVVINFWATWCLPCRAEMPELEAAYRAHESDGLAVLAINLGESREEIVPFGRELGLSFPLLLDPLGQTTAEYGVRGLPTTFFLDRSGQISHIHHGALSSRSLEEQLQRIVR